MTAPHAGQPEVLPRPACTPAAIRAVGPGSAGVRRPASSRASIPSGIHGRGYDRGSGAVPAPPPGSQAGWARSRGLDEQLTDSETRVLRYLPKLGDVGSASQVSR
jgi:hypothetical protein